MLAILLGLMPSLGWQELFLLLVITVVLFGNEMAAAGHAGATAVARWLRRSTLPW